MLVIGTGAWAYRIFGSISKHGGGNLIQAWNGIRNPRSLFPSKDRIVILVVGKDYNYDSKDIAYTKDARADTIMLLSADLATAKLTAVGIPRDTRVTAPDGVTGKINGTFSRGGLPLLQETISKEFGVAVDYHVILKADAVKKIVDAVGGVDVDVLDDMFYEDSWAGLKINLTKGHHHLTGTEAVGFVRFRKTGTHEVGPKGEKIPVHHKASMEEGDLRRADRQQQLVHALVSEALTAKNLVQAPQLIDVAFDQIETNLTGVQAEALATIFKSSAGAGLAGSTIPGKDSTIGGTYYWEPDLDRARLTLDWLLRGNEDAGRHLVRVVVYNGTTDKNAAKTVAETLRGEGYEAISTGAPKDKPMANELVYRKAAYEAYARAIAQQLGIQNVRKDVGDPRADWLPEVKIMLVENAPATTAPGQP